MAPFAKIRGTQAIVDRMNQLDISVTDQIAILNGEMAPPPGLWEGTMPEFYNPEGFYGFEIPPGFESPPRFTPPGPQLVPTPARPPAVALGTVTITLAMLTRALGSSALARQAYNYIANILARGGNVWTSVPGWIRTALIFLGIDQGVDVVLGLLDEDMQPVDGTPPVLAPGTDIVLEQGLPIGVIGKWEANGVWFYRLADGRLAVQNKKGRWKVWRPKRPIVVYATGVADLRTLLRADSAIDRQAKKLDKMLNRRTRRGTRTVACVSCGLVRGHRAGCPVTVTVK